MDGIKLAGICVLASSLALSGCVARTYNLTRDRVDQELSSSAGNRGYIFGKAGEEPTERKTTRTTRVFEIELGLAKKQAANCPSTTPTSAFTPSNEESSTYQETQFEEETTTQNFEKYTVSKNDTLQKISKKFYGTTKKWTKIYEANKNILHGPDKLYPGQILNIPSAGMAEPKENLK